MSEDQTWDVVVVGAGISGCLTALELAKAGYSVLVLEAGPTATATTRVDYMATFYEAEDKTPNAPYPSYPAAPAPRVLDIGKPPDQGYFDQVGPQPFSSSYERVGGGTTWHWLGVAYRLLPDDFTLQTTYGQGTDWPVTYQDLQPWYRQAESLLGVAGDVGALSNLSPYEPGYELPQPAIAQSYLDQQISTLIGDLQFQDTPVQVYSLPQARNSTPWGGRRACMGNTNCIPICPIQAKWDATLFLQAAQQAGATIQFQTVVSDLVADENGVVTGANWIRYQRPDGGGRTTGTVKARQFVLAAHAVENAKLLLNSKSDAFPNGLANSTDAVGRYLMDHPLQLSWAFAQDPVYTLRGPRVSSGLESMRDGPFRKTRGAFRVDIGNEGWNWANNDPYTTLNELVTCGKPSCGADGTTEPEGEGLFGTELREALNAQLVRQFRLGFLVEQLPQWTNRVTLSEKTDVLGIPRPQIYYDLDPYTIAGLQAARECGAAVFQAMGARDCTVLLKERPATQRSDGTWSWTDGFGYFPYQDGYLPFYGSGHIVGTHRMGSQNTKENPAVVNPDLRAWGHPNLWVQGSGAFPTIGTANPTLTLTALTLKSVEALKKALAPTPVSTG